MAIKLSVCIPTYNRAKFLPEALNSIIVQATDEVEIVISDNASEDDTREIVERSKTAFPRIKYHRYPENRGADRNYLKVVEQAEGEYCWLFGSDDRMKEGAIQKILTELSLGYDVYVCGLTLCTFDMKPLTEHRILNVPIEKGFDLSDRQDRIEYFERAETTTAFFSFIGSLIVRKSRWDKTAIDEGIFIGSLWSHVAKILGMISGGLRVKYLPQALLYKRGDNDSFLDHGMVNRLKVQIEGYAQIGDFFFGRESVEAVHMRRVVRNELPLKHFMNAKLDCHERGRNNDLAVLNRIVAAHYSDPSLKNQMCFLVYRFTPVFFYKAVKFLYKAAKPLFSEE